MWAGHLLCAAGLTFSARLFIAAEILVSRWAARRVMKILSCDLALIVGLFTETPIALHWDARLDAAGHLYMPHRNLGFSAVQGAERHAEEVWRQRAAPGACALALPEPYRQPKVGNPGSVLHGQSICWQQARFRRM